MTNTIADLDALKARLKSTWMAGDFGEISKSVESHAEDFIARRTIKPGLVIGHDDRGDQDDHGKRRRAHPVGQAGDDVGCSPGKAVLGDLLSRLLGL